MDNVIINYSQFFNNDGGFDKVVADFKNMGDEMIKEAKRIVKEANLSDLTDTKSILEYENLAESLSDSFKEFKKTKEDLQKIEKEYIKTQNKNIKLSEVQNKNLTQLETQLSKYKTELKENNALERAGVKTLEESASTRADLRVKIKAVSQEITKQQKEIIDLNKVSRQEQKILEANAVLLENRVDNLQDVRDRLSALRIVASQVNITTQEGRDKVAEYNQEINELTDLLNDNSDKFIQSKINIGNYEESIVNALKSNQLFKTNISEIDGVLSSMLGILTLNKEQLNEMEQNLGNNTTAVQRFAIGFGKLNKVLKASIIGAVIIAVASLSSLFGDTRAGAVRLQKITQSLSNGLVIFGKVAKEVSTDVIGFFSDIRKGFQSLSNLSIKDLFTGKAKLSDIFGGEEEEEETKSLFERISDIVKNGSESVVDNLANVDRAFELEDKVRRLNLELTKLNGELEQLQLIADDSTKSFAEQLDANSKSLSKIEEIGKKNEEIARAELEAINERVKSNIKLNQTELSNIDISQKGIGFAEATLDLATRRGASLEISNDLIQEQQDALIKLREIENENALNREENAKKRREIDRDLFEQNLDLLIDLIDTEKNLSEQFINNTSRNTQDRINEFNRLLSSFRINAQKELDEFSEYARKTGQDIDFQIEFNSDGSFDVFQNGIKLSIDNIVELNKELQSLGLAEIPINRLREFLIEARNGVKDFKDLGDAIDQLAVKTKNLLEENSITEFELDELEKINRKRIDLINQANGNVSSSERKRILKELEGLEKEKDNITQLSEDRRLDAQINSLDEQINVLEDAEQTKSERYLELIKQRNELERQLRREVINEEIKDEKEKQKKLLDLQEEREKEARKIGQQIINQIQKTNQQELQQQQDLISRQDQAIDEQRQRAIAGLENTLAFEQERKAEQEAELIRQQKRQERIEKIKTIYTSYTNYANAGEKDPLGKALKDFAILNAITSSFGDGGIVGVDGIEKVRTNSNGVTLGRSHSMRKGILAYHEGGEGFLSRKEMNNIGEKNFRIFKKQASLGVLDKNMFTKQNTDFRALMLTSNTEKPTNNGSDEIVKAIKNKEEFSFDVEGLVDGVLKLTETRKKGNRVKRIHYKVKKNRL